MLIRPLRAKEALNKRVVIRVYPLVSRTTPDEATLHALRVSIPLSLVVHPHISIERGAAGGLDAVRRGGNPTGGNEHAATEDIVVDPGRQSDEEWVLARCDLSSTDNPSGRQR